MTRAFAALLKLSPAAAVVNVSSIASLLGAGSSIAYVASKGALNALTLSLARVLGPQVRVNAVAPGMVDSPWLKVGLGPERFETMRHSYESASALDTLVSARGCGRDHLLPGRRGFEDDGRTACRRRRSPTRAAVARKTDNFLSFGEAHAR